MSSPCEASRLRLDFKTGHPFSRLWLVLSLRASTSIRTPGGSSLRGSFTVCLGPRSSSRIPTRFICGRRGATQPRKTLGRSLPAPIRPSFSRPVRHESHRPDHKCSPAVRCVVGALLVLGLAAISPCSCVPIVQFLCIPSLLYPVPLRHQRYFLYTYSDISPSCMRMCVYTCVLGLVQHTLLPKPPW